MTTDDHRREAARQRRAAASRQGQDRRSFPTPLSRDRGLRRPTPETMSLAEAAADLGPLTVAEALAELEQEDQSIGRQRHPRSG